MNYLFSPTDGANAAGLNYIRVPLGASDFSANTYTYDTTAGDTTFSKFNINNVDGTYLRLQDGIDPKNVKVGWIVTGKDPMPDGWRIEADRDYKEAFRCVLHIRISAIIYSLILWCDRVYYGDTMWLLQQPITTPEEWAVSGLD